MQDYHHMDHDLHNNKVHTKQFNTPMEVIPIIIDTAVHKAKYTWDQLVLLGFISGGLFI